MQLSATVKGGKCLPKGQNAFVLMLKGIMLPIYPKVKLTLDKTRNKYKDHIQGIENETKS
jgi:hypothetical protein